MQRFVTGLLPILLLLLAVPTGALTIDISENPSVSEPVIVTLDSDAEVCFQMNGGTPIYASGSELKFIPHIPGTLSIHAKAGIETATKSVYIASSEPLAEKKMGLEISGTEMRTDSEGRQRIRVTASGNVSASDSAITIENAGNGWESFIINTEGGIQENETAFSGRVSSVTANSEEISGMVGGDVGIASASIELSLERMPDTDAEITTTLTKDPEENVRHYFQIVASDSKKEITGIACTLNVIRNGIENGRDIRSATITMTAGEAWVIAHGGVSKIQIIRYPGGDEEAEILSTTYQGTTEDGRMVFTAISPNGLSVFSLSALRTESVSPEEGGGGSEKDKYRSVTLVTGTFKVTSEEGNPFDVQKQTALGVLDASKTSYSVTDKQYDEYGSLFISSIGGRENSGMKGWMFWVNGAAPSVGSNSYEVSNGDEIVFYWSDSMDSTPENSDKVYYFRAGIPNPESSGRDSDDEKADENTIEEETVTGKFFISLPEGAVLSLGDYGQRLSVDLKAARTAGENLEVSKNDIIYRKDGLVLTITLKDIKEQNDIISGFIDEIQMETRPFIQDISNAGNVSGWLSADMLSIPVETRLSLDLTGSLINKDRNAIMQSKPAEGHHVGEIHYVMDIRAGGLDDSSEISNAMIWMTAEPEWVAEHGGRDAIRIMHLSEDGSAEALETRFTGNDENGMPTFSARSPDGFSTFALVSILPGEPRKPAASVTVGATATETTTTATAKSQTGSGIQPIMIILAIVAILIIAEVAYQHQQKQK